MLTCLYCDEQNPPRARYCHNCGRRLVHVPAIERETRKTVTVLFCDLVSSTRLGNRLGPELDTSVLERYFETASAVLRQHGASLEKFIGDGVVAAFGVPVLHEDDALRAVTAAVALRSALGELNDELDRRWKVRLGVRISVNTGEVVVRDAEDDPTWLLGDVMNVAAKLEQAAAPREILVSDRTYQLVRDTVICESLPAVDLHEGGEPVAVWRLELVDPEARSKRRLAPAPLIGREWDLQVLGAWFGRAVNKRFCHLVNVVGDAGVGKTRLVDAFTQSLRGQATILRGSCRAYGEGIGYRPVAQMLRQSAGIEPGHGPDVITDKLEALAGDRRLAVTVSRVLSARGRTVEPEDARWAVLRFFEAMARRRSLVLVVDDLQWAHDELLELLGHMAEWSRDAAILLVCVGRDELRARLLEQGRKIDVTQFQLTPLSSEETEELVRQILRQGQIPPELPARLGEAAAGYPLFVEELLAMLLDDGRLRLVEDQWRVSGGLDELQLPPTLHALLAARLDELPRAERVLLGRAAVMRSRFPISALVALSPDFPETEVRATVRALTRKELLRPEAIMGDPIPGDDHFTFRHALLRDAAYQSVATQVRADLHHRYAAWIEEQAQDRLPELAEVLGYHLEAAYRYRAQLGLLDEVTDDLGRRAGVWLATAGHDAVLPGDIPAAAVALLTRAVDLLPEGHERRTEALLDLADAHRGAQDMPASLRTFEAAARAAAETGDERRAAHAVLGRVDVLWFSDPRALPDGGQAEVERAMHVLERSNDDFGLTKALRLMAYLHFGAGRSVEARATAEHAIQLARLAGDERLQARVARLYLLILFWGPAPVAEVLEAAETLLDWARQTGAALLEASALNTLARGLAMQGRFDEARRHNSDASGVTLEPGELLTWAASVLSEGLVELLAGELDRAEEILRRGYEEATRARAVGMLSGLTVMLARVLLLRGFDAEAEAMARECRRDASASQLDVRLKAHAIRAVVLARRGRSAEAVRLAEAVRRATGRSEQLDTKAEVLADLAEVLSLAGRRTAAREAADEAIATYESKGNISAASRVQARFAAADRPEPLPGEQGSSSRS